MQGDEYGEDPWAYGGGGGVDRGSSVSEVCFFLFVCRYRGFGSLPTRSYTTSAYD